MAEEIQKGVLYIVPTPIGNLEDITLRALNILKGVDAVAAEDTRTTKFLLDHYMIQKPLISFFSHNEQIRVPQIIDRLKHGEAIAVVSDAGTPGISDPAYSIITAAIENDITIIPLPGATAFIPALIASGLPTHEFVFEGFLPHKKGRKTKLEQLKHEKRTIVFYESPHRIIRTLEDLQEHLGDRKAVIGRELTKKFEEIRRGTLQSLHEHFSTTTIKGEFVIVVAGKET
ncbi:MAG: 16S rRNA (cytidine(1402)-2'-O)-methyltransferase [Bacteroidota bacterium]|nr:16S rRNA (cytidine(1402)-2'-O)-methyltransferase [Bacteroidota bacterium]